jgi:hypothetical protein
MTTASGNVTSRTDLEILDAPGDDSGAVGISEAG